MSDKKDGILEVRFIRTKQAIEGKIIIDYKKIKISLESMLSDFDRFGQQNYDLVYDDFFREDPEEIERIEVERTKIVFINGYDHKKNAEWSGPLPQDGERWTCEEVRDTKPDEPHRGCLLVRLIKNLTAQRIQKEEAEKKELAMIIDAIGDKLELAREIRRLTDEIIIPNQLVKKIRRFAGIEIHANEAIKFLCSLHDGFEKPLGYAHYSNFKSEFMRDHKLIMIAMVGWAEFMGVKKCMGFGAELKRWFRCKMCGATQRMGKEDFVIYQENKDTHTLMCEHCGNTGEIKQS